MASPNDLYYPAHIEKGLNRYIQSDMARTPDFSQLNKMFSNLSNPSLFARGGQMVLPNEEQQLSTPGYLTGRGDVASSYLNNLFSMSALADLVGQNQGGIAAMIPELEAMGTKASAGGFSSLLGAL